MAKAKTKTPRKRKKTPEQIAKEKLARKRVERIRFARAILTGEERMTGLQVWFRHQVGRLSGWEPSEATVHRWFHGKTVFDQIALGVLAELEEAAKKVLRRLRRKIP